MRHTPVSAAGGTLSAVLSRSVPFSVLHIVDFLMHITYLCVLYHYINWPPSYVQPIRLFDTRRTIVLVYTLSRLLRPWSRTTIPPFLVFYSFALNFPEKVTFGSFTFTLLLLALYWEVILLHFPVLPSPLLLAPPDLVLPLSTLARRSLSRLSIPAIFFVPGLFISFLMLQLEMTPFFSRFAPGLIPTDRSTTYLLLFLTFLFFLYCATIYSVLVHPFLAVSQGYKPDMDPWDRYTDSVGLEARKGFFQAVRRYGTAYYFPTPFNLVQVLAVRIPRLALVALRRNVTVESITSIDKALWRVIVGPIAVIVSGLWLWYLRV